MMVIQAPCQRHCEHSDRGDDQTADEQDTLSSTHLYACAADYAAFGALESGAHRKLSNIDRVNRSSLVYRLHPLPLSSG